MLKMKDPKSAIYFYHNLVWYQCKLLRDLGLVIALCSMEIVIFYKIFGIDHSKLHEFQDKIHKSVHHYPINVILLDI